VGGKTLLFPVETISSAGGLAHDGLCGVAARMPEMCPVARQTLVVACCDPAVGLLANLYARMSGLRLVVISRSSQQSLELLAQGLVHVAGLHLASREHRERNTEAVRAKLGEGYQLLRVCRWQEGLAVGKDQRARSVRSLAGARLRWIGREPGSAAHECMAEMLPGKVSARRIARDHRGVAEAIRSGWADAGVCLRLVCEEAGLNFLPLRDEYFEFCFPVSMEADPRLSALVRVIRSAEYRRMMSELPGYSLSGR
jgi:molybdate-binding protein